MRLAALVLTLLFACPWLARAQDAASAEPPVPPVMVAVLPSGHVPDDVTAAVQASLVEVLGTLSGGRAVLPLALAELRDRLAACVDAPCRGALVAESGAIGAVLARLSRRTTRGDVSLAVELIDPISGTPRAPELTASLADAAAVGPALASMVESIRPIMFSPPPPPSTLLVTVDVDGATVSIDDAAIGESPVASVRVPPGHHVVTVTHDGYAGTRRDVEIGPGQQSRLDVTLARLASTGTIAPGSAPGEAAAPGPEWYELWYVWVGIGAGVLVVGGAIAGGVVASQPSTPPDPTGIPLPGIRF